MAFIRLLQLNPDGSIAFRETSGSDVPAYAILSHTWGKEEVIFRDMKASADKSKTVSKAGWRKIQFCAKQAAADGLQYFWIDTCCIDKKNAVELSAAINSMFRWYQEAVRCYVYLSDVSKASETDGEETWKEVFEASRWFTRGWTLQELIAPRLVDFFSSEGKRLGDKVSLESNIHVITGISKNALRGDTLSSFSIKERRSWAEQRKTTVEEDGTYCLIGIFGISMPLVYGEGKDHALRRLEEEIHKLYKGVDFERYAVPINLASIPEAAQFVAREEQLLQMHERLCGHSRRSAVVLHGLGGIGKTQLALEYIRKYKEKHTAIFWLNANDENSLRLSFRNVGQQILKAQPLTALLRNIDFEGDLDQVVSAVKAWLDLQDNTSWLLIYDNYDNPRTSSYSDNSTVDVRQYLPGSDQGSVIITTRSAAVTQGRQIHVQKLAGLEDGLQILSNMSGRGNVRNDPDAQALVEELDGLPLALSTAGLYLKHVTTSFAEYLRLYKASWSKLQRTSPKLDSYADSWLYTTWNVTFDRIQKEDAASAQLLKLWAYFDKQDLWFGLLQHAQSTDDEWIQTLTSDEMDFNKTVRLLCEYGLVHPEASSSQLAIPTGYSLHGCVHSWTISVLNEEWDDKLSEFALTCVASAVPDTDATEWWLHQRRLLQHAAKVEQSITSGTVDITRMEWALHSLGALYAAQGKLAEAEKMYERVLQGYETLGASHTSILDILSNLGNFYLGQGKLAEAEKMYEWALQGKEERLGASDTSTLNTVNNLGNLYLDQGKLVEAEKMFTRALQGMEKAFGDSHTSTLNTVNNLGNVYLEQDELVEAERMYKRALQGFEEALGASHTRTLQIVNNLGIVYSYRGKLADTEKMYKWALRGYEETLGASHTSTLNTVHNLGMLYKTQGRLSEAERMSKLAVQGYKDALGNGPALRTLRALNAVENLGDVYREQGAYANARAMYSDALIGLQEVLGPPSNRCVQLTLKMNTLDALLAEVHSQRSTKRYGPDRSSQVGHEQRLRMRQRAEQIGGTSR